jgi:hypothetical protein
VSEICYVGVRGERAEVFVEERWENVVKRERLDPRPSQRLWNHSPDGFEWGFGGSGPAQLALAILLDAIHRRPFRVKVSELVEPGGWNLTPTVHAARIAVRLHQEFKRSHVQPLDRDGFRLSMAEVEKFLAVKGAWTAREPVA